MNNRTRLLITGVLLLIIFLGAFLWWRNGLASVNEQDKSEKIFLIHPGAGMREISNNLKEEGLIRDPVVFFLLVKQLRLDSKVQAGDFRLSPSMSAEEIAKELTMGTLDIWITIPEGKRATEIAEILQAKMPEYDESWVTALEANEGYLFPDTYLIPKDYVIENIIPIFTNTFDAKLKEAGISRDDPQLSEIVIIASLLEREANTDAEKPVIAGIIRNRLESGIALQVDATIQYAKGKIGTKWWAPVTVSEYKSVNSPYNTYLSPGLPPGPISNPGIESLKAAAKPQNTNFVYYIHDNNGQIRYAKTLEEHNANIRRYGVN